MSRLLQEGGKIIYVAPSGGRDRRNSEGHIEVAPFDPASIEMFYLMAKKAKTPTHFIPFALATYDLTSPSRNDPTRARRNPHRQKDSRLFVFAAPFDMETFRDRKKRTQKREKQQSEYGRLSMNV